MAVFDTLVNIAFHGMAYAMVLYLISVGLSVTMGLLGIANLAHGVFAMAGGYVALTLTNDAGWPLAASLAASFLGVALISAVLERTLYARLYGATELEQVLFSIGVIFVGTAIFHFYYGPLTQRVSLPATLQGSLAVAGFSFPLYRAVLIAIGVAVFAALWFGVERTLVGARIRATVDNKVMAQTVGINTGRLFTAVFALGSGLAALGGSLGAEIIPLFPGYASEHLASFLIVVAVGGLGTIRGPFLSSILLGVSDTACKILVPDLAAFFIYAAVFVILSLKPAGLFGVKR